MYTTLSQREWQIATLITTGASNKQIARQLAISIKTVKNTLTKVFVKTNTCSRTELAVRLIRAESRLPEYAALVPQSQI